MCKTAAMKNIQKINRVTEVMWREIRELMGLKKVHFRGKRWQKKQEVATASCTVNQTFSYKSGIEWR